jgi:hypothetical protein
MEPFPARPDNIVQRAVWIERGIRGRQEGIGLVLCPCDAGMARRTTCRALVATASVAVANRRHERRW